MLSSQIRRPGLEPAKEGEMKYKVPDNPMLFNEVMMEFRSPRAWELFYNRTKAEEEKDKRPKAAAETPAAAEAPQPVSRTGGTWTRKAGAWELPMHNSTPSTSVKQEDFPWHAGAYSSQGTGYEWNRTRDHLTAYTEEMLKARQRAF